MEIHPATNPAEPDRAPLGNASENRAQFAAGVATLLALMNLLCRHLGITVATPAKGWTVSLLLYALAGIIPALRPRRRRTPELRPFIPRRLRRGSPELLIVHAYRLPPRDPARPLRRLPPRPRQGRGPPARAHLP